MDKAKNSHWYLVGFLEGYRNEYPAKDMDRYYNKGYKAGVKARIKAIEIHGLENN